MWPLCMEYLHAAITVLYSICLQGCILSILIYTLHTDSGIYNAIWDDKVLLCYNLLQCKCGKQLGASVHSTSCDNGLQALVGKVSFNAIKTLSKLMLYHPELILVRSGKDLAAYTSGLDRILHCFVCMQAILPQIEVTIES